jgi:catechol 2,3-dioxygenase-like lactoylglutathione lyase family enzyme
MGATMKIALTSISVNNPVDAFKFYTEVLGFVEKMYMPDAHLAIVAAPEDPDGTQILLEPNDSPLVKPYQEGIYKAGLPVMVFEVEDIQEEYTRLISLGVVFANKPTKEDWGTQAIFDDTCGNYLQIFQK